ncbi:MAG: FtsQ-type POTRA domain-containing protein [Synechococcales bacterium]|nr:FtsQ-type POTRA domain-containing protein [Synechococcales bacterium]
MADFYRVSPVEIEQRRQNRRRQRRWKLLAGIWRFLLVAGLAGALAWVISLPGWVIRSASQIQVKGNEFLSVATVQSLMPIEYPQSLLTLKPHLLAEALQAKGPIAEAVVTRHLLPPQLTVQIQEQHPVAILIGNTYVGDPLYGEDSLPPGAAPPTSPVSPLAATGLLDENGLWMPLERYTEINQDLKLPDLKIVGMRATYRTQWSSLYQAMQQSPIEVFEIDWRNPADLVINTDVGIVHLGSYEASKFVTQLARLDQMRHLAQSSSAAAIQYIDLRNPDQPFAKIHGAIAPLSNAESAP